MCRLLLLIAICAGFLAAQDVKVNGNVITIVASDQLKCVVQKLGVNVWMVCYRNGAPYVNSILYSPTSSEVCDDPPPNTVTYCAIFFWNPDQTWLARAGSYYSIWGKLAVKRGQFK